MIELFAGYGGVALGCLNAMFQILLAIDNNDNAIKNYMNNIGKHIVNSDIFKVTAAEILKLIKLSIGELDYAHFSPPCIAISKLGKQNPFDLINRLYFKSIELIHAIQPKVFTIETVANIASETFSGLLNSMLYDLVKEGLYRFEYRILNAEDYGVPQSRKRFILIGVRKDLNLAPVFPIPNDFLVSMKEVCPDIDFFRSTQYSKKLKSAFSPCCTLTASQSLIFLKNKAEVKPEVSELAILSTFPKTYKFEGSYTEQCKGIGNCVPPKLSEAIARTIKEQILDKYYDSLNNTAA